MVDKQVKVGADKDRYVSGETIRISGNIGNSSAGEPVYIQVFGPQNKPHRHEEVSQLSTIH